jgi:hypothetical protein
MDLRPTSRAMEGDDDEAQDGCEPYYDVDKLRVPSYRFRPERLQVARSFESLRSMLGGLGVRMQWEFVSTEMSKTGEAWRRFGMIDPAGMIESMAT